MGSEGLGLWGLVWAGRWRAFFLEDMVAVNRTRLDASFGGTSRHGLRRTPTPRRPIQRPNLRSDIHVEIK